MGCIIELRKGLNSAELDLIRELDERLEAIEEGLDSRIALSGAHLIVDEIDGRIAITLVGWDDREEIVLTVAGQDIHVASMSARPIMCQIFKVEPDKPPV